MANEESKTETTDLENVDNSDGQPFIQQIDLNDYPESYQQAVADAQAHFDLMHIVAKELADKGFSKDAIKLLTGVSDN